MDKKSNVSLPESAHSGAGKDGERMKKPWIKRFAAAAFAVTFTAGIGMTMLSAAGEEEEMSGKSGGGYFQN